MVPRRQLGQMVQTALQTVVDEVYKQQLVNSERSFQAAMWEALRWQFTVNSRNTYKIFIEPRLSIRGTDKELPPSVRFPDLVVCNRDAVVGVFELKFRPRGMASSVKDLKTMALLAANRKRLIVKNERFHPRTEVKEYAMADSVLFGWVAIVRKAGEDFGKIKGIRNEHLRSFVYLTEDEDEDE
ncbi:MAG TPA: hypothetical protein VHA82_11935 [Ramlibacter sp.]|uniref:hypothetical protein n=1 Tax=Ramlibacter sp. TaxID=1917967 RepID=UPI002B99F48A|nr:hypothetical protein [Ramlibacter sp.]HVZ44512.1 hypothetical protein [Ramlibacter sp.]